MDSTPAVCLPSALDCAHKQVHLHRDVEPANIMLTDLDDDGEQRVVLADFGMARDLDDISGLTTTNMTVGTVAYAAPEQLMGENVPVAMISMRWLRRHTTCSPAHHPFCTPIPPFSSVAPQRRSAPVGGHTPALVGRTAQIVRGAGALGGPVPIPDDANKNFAAVYGYLRQNPM